MIDLLVISHPCVTAINRVIYRELAAIGWDLELVVPSSLSAEHGYFRKSDPPVPGDPPIHELERLGDNQRLHFYRGLLPLLEAKRPRLVLLETDPGCTVAIEVGLWARARGAHVFCQTAENMDRRFSDRLRL